MREYYKMSVHKVVLLKEGEHVWTLKTINKDGSEDVEEILPCAAHMLLEHGDWKEKRLDW